MNVQALTRFRQNLHTLMQQRGITQRQLADAAKTSYPNINRILKGKTEPGLEISDRLAGAAGFQLWEMLVDPITFSKKILPKNPKVA